MKVLYVSGYTDDVLDAAELTHEDRRSSASRSRTTS